MLNIKSSIYGLFITTFISLLVGITLLILEIVFNYVGFTNNDFTIISCTDPYLNIKYLHLKYQIQVAFIATCIALTVLITILILYGLTAKNLYQYNQNNQQQLYQYLSPQLLSKNKYSIKYILTSFGTLANLVSFGIYLTFLVESKKDPLTCSFTYNQNYLLGIVILSGISLLGFMVMHVFLLITRKNFINLQQNETKQNKYKQMINITEQPGLITKKDPYQNYNQYPQYTQQHFDGDTQSFGNKQFIKKQTNETRNPHYNQNQSILNSQNSFAGNNPKKEKQTFQQYRARQMKELIERKNHPSHQNQTNPTHMHFQDPNYHPYQNQISPQSQDVLNFYQNEKDHQRNDSFGKQNNNKLKPYSPIRILGQNINDQPKFNESIQSPYNRENKSRYQNSPESKAFNNMNQNSYRPEQSYRGSQQDTRGQLVFYKKALQKSRKEGSDINQPFKSKNNKLTYSSGEVSFKSPSKFQSKFAEEQNDYLRRNAQNSILPSNSIKEVTGGSRKVIFDDKYSSSGVPASNFGQSRNLDSSPSHSRSRTKTRQGVLTSYIRGKFS